MVWSVGLTLSFIVALSAEFIVLKGNGLMYFFYERAFL